MYYGDGEGCSGDWTALNCEATLQGAFTVFCYLIQCSVTAVVKVQPERCTILELALLLGSGTYLILITSTTGSKRDSSTN
jgi:hypothetical protein